MNQGVIQYEKKIVTATFHYEVYFYMIQSLPKMNHFSLRIWVSCTDYILLSFSMNWYKFPSMVLCLLHEIRCLYNVFFFSVDTMNTKQISIFLKPSVRICIIDLGMWHSGYNLSFFSLPTLPFDWPFWLCDYKQIWSSLKCKPKH